VINRCKGANGGQRARKKIDPVDEHAVIEIPEQITEVMTHFYGRAGISPHKIIELFDPKDPAEREAKRRQMREDLGFGSVGELNTQFKNFKEWYVQVMHAFHNAILGEGVAGPTADGRAGDG
jgi:hypothetical protein